MRAEATSGQSAVIAAALFLAAAAATITLPDARGRAAGVHWVADGAPAWRLFRARPHQADAGASATR